MYLKTFTFHMKKKPHLFQTELLCTGHYRELPPPLAINCIAKYMYFDYLEGPGDQQDRVPLAFPESLLSLGVLKVRDTIKTF